MGVVRELSTPTVGGGGVWWEYMRFVLAGVVAAGVAAAVIAVVVDDAVAGAVGVVAGIVVDVAGSVEVRLGILRATLPSSHGRSCL